MNIENMEDKKIIVEIDGKNKECDILFTYDNETLPGTLVCYTDNSVVDSKKQLYTGYYDPLNPNKILPINDPDEVDQVNKLLKELGYNI